MQINGIYDVSGLGALDLSGEPQTLGDLGDDFDWGALATTVVQTAGNVVSAAVSSKPAGTGQQPVVVKQSGMGLSPVMILGGLAAVGAAIILMKRR